MPNGQKKVKNNFQGDYKILLRCGPSYCLSVRSNLAIISPLKVNTKQKNLFSIK